MKTLKIIAEIEFEFSEDHRHRAVCTLDLNSGSIQLLERQCFFDEPSSTNLIFNEVKFTITSSDNNQTLFHLSQEDISSLIAAIKDLSIFK
jgi:hypothetical protein